MIGYGLQQQILGLSDLNEHKSAGEILDLRVNVN